MNETEAFITQLCRRPARCDFHCRGESRRAGMHHGCGVGKRRDRQLMHDARSGWGMKNNESTCRMALWERGEGDMRI